MTSILAWKENAIGNVSKCAFHFLNIKGYSFGSFNQGRLKEGKEVGKKYCQVHYSKRVSKRKTSGKKAHFEPVRFLLSVLLLLSKWCMKERSCMYIAICKNLLWRAFQCIVCYEKCHAVMLVYFWCCCLS